MNAIIVLTEAETKPAITHALVTFMKDNDVPWEKSNGGVIANIDLTDIVNTSIQESLLQKAISGEYTVTEERDDVSEVDPKPTDKKIKKKSSKTGILSFLNKKENESDVFIDQIGLTDLLKTVLDAHKRTKERSVLDALNKKHAKTVFETISVDERELLMRMAANPEFATALALLRQIQSKVEKEC